MEIFYTDAYKILYCQFLVWAIWSHSDCSKVNKQNRGEKTFYDFDKESSDYFSQEANFFDNKVRSHSYIFPKFFLLVNKKLNTAGDATVKTHLSPVALQNLMHPWTAWIFSLLLQTCKNFNLLPSAHVSKIQHATHQETIRLCCVFQRGLCG